VHRGSFEYNVLGSPLGAPVVYTNDGVDLSIPMPYSVARPEAERRDTMGASSTLTAGSGVHLQQLFEVLVKSATTTSTEKGLGFSWKDTIKTNIFLRAISSGRLSLFFFSNRNTNTRVYG